MATSMKINKKGLRELDINLKKALEVIVSSVGDEAVDIALEIMAESEDEVPVATGTLQSSTFVEQLEDGTVLFGYGVFNDLTNPKTGLKASEYMIIVHEDLTMNHPNGGKAKFFEDPVFRALARIDKRLADAARRGIGGGR